MTETTAVPITFLVAPRADLATMAPAMLRHYSRELTKLVTFADAFTDYVDGPIIAGATVIHDELAKHAAHTAAVLDAAAEDADPVGSVDALLDGLCAADAEALRIVKDVTRQIIARGARSRGLLRGVGVVGKRLRERSDENHALRDALAQSKPVAQSEPVAD